MLEPEEDPGLRQRLGQLLAQARSPGVELGLARAAAALEERTPEEAIEALAPFVGRTDLPPRDNAWVHGLMARAHLSVGRVDSAADFARAALSLARSVNDSVAANAFGMLLAQADPSMN